MPVRIMNSAGMDSKNMMNSACLFKDSGDINSIFNA